MELKMFKECEELFSHFLHINILRKVLLKKLKVFSLVSSRKSSETNSLFLSIWIIIFIISTFLFLNVSFSKAEKIQDKQFNKIKIIIQGLSQKGAKIGCQFVNAKTKEILWAYHPDDPLIPASNTKLLTTAVSLIRLGPNYRFKTGVYTSNLPLDGIVHGDLYLKGFGDPFLRDY